MAIPNKPGLIIVPDFTIANEPILIRWEASTGATEYTLERSSDWVLFSEVYTGAALSYSDNYDGTSNTVVYRIKAANTDGDSGYTYSPEIAIVTFLLDYNEDGMFRPINMIVNFSKSTIEALPAIRETVEQIPGVDGAMCFDIKYEPRAFNIEGWTLPDLTRHERDKTEEEIAICLHAVRDTERYLLYRDKLYRVRMGGKMQIDKHPSYLDLQIPLKAYDPHGEMVSHGLLIGSGEAVNNGAEICYPVFMIFGAYNNPTLTVNGVEYAIAGTAIDGDITIIDCYNRTVMRVRDGVTTNIIGAWFLDFPAFPPGANTVSYSGVIITRYRGRFITI